MTVDLLAYSASETRSSVGSENSMERGVGSQVAVAGTEPNFPPLVDQAIATVLCLNSAPFFHKRPYSELPFLQDNTCITPPHDRSFQMKASRSLPL
jgi:hypothetical protein